MLLENRSPRPLPLNWLPDFIAPKIRRLWQMAIKILKSKILLKVLASKVSVFTQCKTYSLSERMLTCLLSERK